MLKEASDRTIVRDVVRQEDLYAAIFRRFISWV